MKWILGILHTAVLSAIATGAWCQTSGQRYPSKPIRLIQPFPPGGGADVAARFVSRLLSERLGETVVVDNRGGAGGAIGTELAAQATPDGYTFLMATASTIIINPLLNKVRFSPLGDFDAVVHIADVPLILLVHPALPAKSVQELINLAKAQPGKINFASSGDGTISHLAGELFKLLTRTDMVHVPYRGGGPARTAVMGGQVQVNFGNMLASTTDVRAGRLRALGVSTSRRTQSMPDLPTLQEVGVAHYEVIQWSGMLAPRGTPRIHIDRINREVNTILDLPKAKHFFVSGGSEAVGGTTQAFALLIKSEIAKWQKVIEQSKLKVNR